MVADDAREKALHTIAKLKRLAEHPNTPPAEAEVARNRIVALQEKHGITANEPPPQKNVFFTRLIKEDARRRAEERERREAAQRRYEEWRKDRDDYGRQKDPFEEALRRDGRTHEEKVRDMNQSWGQAHAVRCAKPETFFDSGGEPRKRNTYRIKCDRCGVTLEPGEGTVFQVGGTWYGRCCERVPGPRSKKR
jgi:hypothetical protein